MGAAASNRDVMKNGLYSIHVTLLDGRVGKGSGVILFRDGQILGGDAYLYYTGSYTFRNGKWRGDMTVNQHTEAVGRTLAFGGREVTCGFSSDYSAGGAEVEGMALVGKTSVTFTARLTLKGPMVSPG